MTHITDEEMADLVDKASESASAYMRGDVRRCLALISHSDDYTLMAPYGGEPSFGADTSEESLDATSAFFQHGEAELQVHASYRSGDLAVLVAIERQHGEVGGTPDQDWSLRVTLVYRRVGDRWLIVHRHADPLVTPIGMDTVSQLARGALSGS